MLSRDEESCGEVGLNSGLSGFFMVGEDISAGGKNQYKQTQTNELHAQGQDISTGLFLF